MHGWRVARRPRTWPLLQCAWKVGGMWVDSVPGRHTQHWPLPPVNTRGGPNTRASHYVIAR